VKYLVTGGAGFLGSHLSERLISLGHSIVCVDNLQTGSLSNLSTLLGYRNFEFVQQDVRELDTHEVDGIFNLACPASPVQYQKNPVDTLTTNVIGALSVLKLATKLNVCVLQASTSEVYGDPLVSPQREDYWGNVNPIGIRSCYDEGKRAAETLFFDFERQYKTSIKIARIFNTFGPRMAIDDGRVVSNFIIQALRGEPITIYGDGLQTRSFCYVDDLIDGLIKFMKTPNLTGPLNFGNNEEANMVELASEILHITKSKSEIVFKKLPEDDPKVRQPDTKRTLKAIEWSATTTRETGLRHTVEYFEKVLGREV
jgi:UDP-glucuronate decarboxylase